MHRSEAEQAALHLQLLHVKLQAGAPRRSVCLTLVTVVHWKRTL